MIDAISALESIFSSTTLCHLDGVLQSAELMRYALERAISSLHDLPDLGVTDKSSIRILDEAMARLFEKCEENAERMKALLANADLEVLALQDLLVEFAS